MVTTLVAGRGAEGSTAEGTGASALVSGGRFGSKNTTASSRFSATDPIKTLFAIIWFNVPFRERFRIS
jgi:hypothetical protein